MVAYSLMMLFDVTAARFGLVDRNDRSHCRGTNGQHQKPTLQVAHTHLPQISLARRLSRFDATVA